MNENFLSRRRVLGLGVGLGAATALSLAGCGDDPTDSRPGRVR